jgi:dipeptidyl aminopeptidase/acylaminoacyl peptidase
MQDDVTDGVRAMIDQKLADPRRVCIMGWGYGGYVALAGAAFTPDLYACAISVSGISDLRALFEETVPQSTSRLLEIHSPSISVWTERIGAPGDSALDRKSPIHSVASIKAPILIMYGTGDRLVPYAQSLSMEEALRSAGKQVALVKMTDGVSRNENRVQMLRAFDDFLHDNLQKSESP